MTSMSCSFCWDDLSDDNMCSYRTFLKKEWLPSAWCVTCVKAYLGTQHQAWIDGVRNATCPKELQRLIDVGPPIWLHDAKTFVVPEGDHLYEFNHNNETFSARLVNAVEGADREKLWNEMRAVMYVKAQEMNKKN